MSWTWKPPWIRRAGAWVAEHELTVVTVLALMLLMAGLWSFQLIDPWETHYSEVARRMLQDHDWVFLKWQNESFRSKPVLTFWLIGASDSLLGVARGGGYSGELVQGHLPELASRLPFALFGAFGLVMAFWMLRRLCGRRVAWLGFGVLATTPFYMLISRQAITDMPMCACLIGAVACFAMMVHEGSGRWPSGGRGCPRGWCRRRSAAVCLRDQAGGLTAEHGVLAALTVFVLWQSLYLAVYFHRQPPPGARPAPVATRAAPMRRQPAGAVGAARLEPALAAGHGTAGPVYMHWFYVLVGISILGKGPVEPGVLGLLCLLYLVLTGRWRLLRRIEIARGTLIAALICVPWHLAMYFKDGMAWAQMYFVVHIWNRFFHGVNNSVGTWNYFSSQLGVGMWPWVALLPAALATALLKRSRRTPASDVRFLVAIWAVAGVFTFTFSTTKFHYYILPAVPALGLLVAFWIDDVLDGRAGRVALIALLAATLSLLATRDLAGDQKEVIELFCYMYGRPWPSGAPWNVDVSGPIIWTGVAAVAFFVLLALPFRKTRIAALLGLGATALTFTVWVTNGYMHAAAPHWGQRHLWRTYYEQRAIHGLEIRYASLRDLADQWGPGGVDSGDVLVESVLPDGFKTGQAQTVRLLLPGSGLPGDKIELHGTVARIGHDRFWIAIPAAERARLTPLISRGRTMAPSPTRPWSQVDADRLIAWQLNWRGENYWSSGEILGRDPRHPDGVRQQRRRLQEVRRRPQPPRPALLPHHRGGAPRDPAAPPADPARPRHAQGARRLVQQVRAPDLRAVTAHSARRIARTSWSLFIRERPDTSSSRARFISSCLLRCLSGLLGLPVPSLDLLGVRPA